MEIMIKDEEAYKIFRKWINHLMIEHGLPAECEVIREITWFAGEAIDKHVTLGLPKPQKDEAMP